MDSVAVSYFDAGYGVEQIIGDCKGGLRHAWYPTTTDRRPQVGLAYIAHRCERGCGSVRLMAVGSQGQPIGKWRYLHDDDRLYRSIHVESLDDWRAQYLKRMRRQKRKR